MAGGDLGAEKFKSRDITWESQEMKNLLRTVPRNSQRGNGMCGSAANIAHNGSPGGHSELLKDSGDGGHFEKVNSR